MPPPAPRVWPLLLLAATLVVPAVGGQAPEAAAPSNAGAPSIPDQLRGHEIRVAVVDDAAPYVRRPRPRRAHRPAVGAASVSKHATLDSIFQLPPTLPPPPDQIFHRDLRTF